MAAITTDRQVKAIQPGKSRSENTIAGTPGLSLIVQPSGTRSFVLRYVALNGDRKRLALGQYPGISLADARAKAASLKVGVVDGADPAAERSAKREAARTGDTLEQLAQAYWLAAMKGLHGGRRRPKRPSTLSSEKNRWTQHIAPALGARKFAEIRRADIKGFMRELASAGALSADTVSSIGRTLSSILAFAVYEERLEANPASGLTRPLALKQRERMFDDHALRTIWAVAERAGDPMESRLDLSTAGALQFAMLTLCRRGEVAGARWSEIDLPNRKWTIPKERAKSHRAHVVPLSDAALTILQGQKELSAESGSPFVFPAPRDPARSIAPEVLTRALTRICEREGLPHGTPHDFRRSGATTLTSEAIGKRRFIVSKVLGHASYDGAAAVTEVYDRNDYLSEKREALDAWAKYLVDRDNEAPANVVSMIAAHGRKL